MREYQTADSLGCCVSCMTCCDLNCDLCCGLCDPCYYHGAHTFNYEDFNSTKAKDAISVKTVGHDDMAWYVEERRRWKRRPKFPLNLSWITLPLQSCIPLS
jgi:hypothetical protein